MTPSARLPHLAQAGCTPCRRRRRRWSSAGRRSTAAADNAPADWWPPAAPGSQTREHPRRDAPATPWDGGVGAQLHGAVPASNRRQQLGLHWDHPCRSAAAWHLTLAPLQVVGQRALALPQCRAQRARLVERERQTCPASPCRRARPARRRRCRCGADDLSQLRVAGLGAQPAGRLGLRRLELRLGLVERGRN